MRRLLDVRGLARLRLSSVLPAYFTEELIELIAGERRVCRHLHVPLQSGSDRVLRAMRRPYNARMYRALIERLAAAIPDLGLGADVITGFPGRDGRRLRRDRGARRGPAVHLSPRLLVLGPPGHRGGPADRRPACRPRRSGSARPASGASAPPSSSGSAGPRSAASSTVLVLEHRERETGRLVGLTDNYLELAFPGPDALMRGFARVRATGRGRGEAGRGARQRWVSRESASSEAAGSTSWRV